MDERDRHRKNCDTMAPLSSSEDVTQAAIL
jgi:hypothetical protein